ncbi:PDZ domain-containing protein [Salimicrobium halophilum]|uniref:PDZ domain-containing protein n=2 Tax=Salimicrobium halophilum TaxID=86666 RepID=A0A1G8V4T1_9BACI|nr:PDZ domain-containing protein [Salimicrobium halophilum]
MMAFSRLFMQPLWYMVIAFSLVLTVWRIKKERQMFGVRIHPVLAEWTQTKASILYSLLLSLLFILIGVEVSLAFSFVLAGVALILTLTGGFRWYSFIYIGGVALVAALLLNQFSSWTVPVSVTGVAVLLTGVALFEARHLKQLTMNDTFPERMKGPRGKDIGQHRVRRLQWLPVVTLFPTGGLPEFFYFPLLETGDGYGLIILPLFSVYEWTARAELPSVTAEKLSIGMRNLGVLAMLLVAVSYWVPSVAFAAIGVLVLGRLLLFFKENKTHMSLFHDSTHGLRVLAVVPGSPAAKLGIEAGEIIHKVNGVQVNSEKQMYEQLHFRGAFTKLEIKDRQGEIRHAGRALYESDHHELGLIFVRSNHEWEEDIGFSVE